MDEWNASIHNQRGVKGRTRKEKARKGKGREARTYIEYF